MTAPKKKGDVASKRQLVIHKLERLAEGTTHAPEAAAAREKLERLKVHTEHVQVAPAMAGRSQGEITIGHWYAEGEDVIVICDFEGRPLQHRNIATRVVLLPDQTARQVARRVIGEMHRAGGSSAGFYRRIRYPNRSPV